MTISIVGLSSNATSTSTSQVPAGFDPQSPLSILQNKEDSALAQLSSLGQVKFSLADLQNKAGALKNFSKPPTFADLQVVVEGFVRSFNSLNKNVRALTSKQGAFNADNRSGQALNSVNNAIAGANGNGLFALQKMGISQQANGTFSINQNQLAQSFQDNRPDTLSTIFDLANRVTSATDKYISANGLIGKRVDNLSARVNDLENMRSKPQGNLDTQKIIQQFTTAQAPSTSGFTVRNAVATYTSVASL